MNATAPPKPAVILAAPINVEESRAQRLQRQQARFRDRGGIFVPTNRSTLLDILLGRASPLKKPRRSASASPSRAKSTDNEVSKPALRRSPRKQSQKKKINPNADDDIEDDVPLVKSKAKGKTFNKTKPKAGVDGEKGTSTTRGRNSATTSAAVTSSTRLKRTRKVEPIFSELSEDDAACSMPTKNVATTKVNKFAPPPDISNQDEVKGPPSDQGVETSLLKDMLGVARPAKSLNASDDGNDDIRSKSNLTTSQGKPQDDSAYKLTKKSSTNKVLEDDFVCKPVKKSTKESAIPLEMGKCRSLEEHNLAKEDTPSSESTSKAVVAFSKGNWRTSASIVQGSDSQLRRKLVESGTNDIDPSLHKNLNLSGKAPLIASKKRRRNPKDAESGGEDSADKGTKRKKRSSPSETRQSPEITVVDEDSVKPVAKRSRKVAKSICKGEKQGSDNFTTTLKRKENAPMSKPSKVTSNSGPPKSVLQRIKNSLGAQVIDNEPDPIDFLS